MLLLDLHFDRQHGVIELSTTCHRVRSSLRCISAPTVMHRLMALHFLVKSVLFREKSHVLKHQETFKLFLITESHIKDLDNLLWLRLEPFFANDPIAHFKSDPKIIILIPIPMMCIHLWNTRLHGGVVKQGMTVVTFQRLLFRCHRDART